MNETIDYKGVMASYRGNVNISTKRVQLGWSHKYKVS